MTNYDSNIGSKTTTTNNGWERLSIEAPKYVWPATSWYVQPQDFIPIEPYIAKRVMFRCSYHSNTIRWYETMIVDNYISVDEFESWLEKVWKENSKKDDAAIFTSMWIIQWP